MSRPAPDEFHEYYGRYIGLVPDGDIVATLSTEMEATRALLASVPPDREEYRYAEGKWTLREVVGHLIDVERLFALRALWAARRSQGEQPGMEQDAWAAASNAGARPLAGLAEEWAALRHANVLMFAGFDADTWSRRCRASGREFTVRALAWAIAGHERYHRALLKRDYLGGGA
jgi:uncharacterized damage-inducible protein DinB